MSDAFSTWRVFRRQVGAASFTLRTILFDASARFFDDGDPVPAEGWEYRLTQTTTGGVVVPYNDVRINNPGGVIWAIEAIGTSTVAEILDTKIASDGSVIICGDFQGTITIKGTTLTSAGGYDGFLVKLNSDSSLAWVKQYSSLKPGTTDSGDESARGVTVDSSGNVYVTGSFMATMTLDNGVTLTSVNDAFGRIWSDVFVVKYNSAGVQQWAHRYGGSSPDTGDAITVDNSGNLYFISRLDSVGADYGSVTLDTHGNVDFAICKANASGVVQWAVNYGGTDIDWAHGLAVDSNGNVFVCGETWSGTGGVTNIGGGSVSVNYGPNIFLAKYRVSSGEYLWGKIFSNESANRAYGVAVDPSTDNVVMVGGFGGTLDFSAGAVPNQSITGGMFIAAYQNDGTYLWSKGYGASSLVDSLLSIDIDNAGNLAVAGVAYAGAVDFGTSNWLIGNGNANLIIGSLRITGNSPPTLRWQWRSGAGTNGISQANAVSLVNGAAVLTGTFQQTISVSPNGPQFTSASNHLHGFLVKYAN